VSAYGRMGVWACGRIGRIGRIGRVGRVGRVGVWRCSVYPEVFRGWQDFSLVRQPPMGVNLRTQGVFVPEGPDDSSQA
jgi:hypothetical protein